ncbi:MAG: hypothetical protein K2X47_11330 [Bdellovibrionales bacterium]|nr:hypothetical protein [Bdellovibrionales bacterium]
MVKDWMQEKTTRKLNPWIVLFVIFTLAYFAMKTQGPLALADGSAKAFCVDPQFLDLALDARADSSAQF